MSLATLVKKYNIEDKMDFDTAVVVYLTKLCVSTASLTTKSLWSSLLPRVLWKTWSPTALFSVFQSRIKRAL